MVPEAGELLGVWLLMFVGNLLLVWASRRPLGCGVPTVPILVWNVVCTRFLPPALASNEFSRAIPPLVTYGENTLRIVVMVLPFLMPLESRQAASAEASCCLRRGDGVLCSRVGPVMIAPQSGWSTSWLGFVAPAYTPIVWLTGLGLIAAGYSRARAPYRRWMYVALACGFVAFHVTHTSIVYARNYPHQAATRGEGR